MSYTTFNGLRDRVTFWWDWDLLSHNSFMITMWAKIWTLGTKVGRILRVDHE